jgi:hypothetical protein
MKADDAETTLNVKRQMKLLANDRIKYRRAR